MRRLALTIAVVSLALTGAATAKLPTTASNRAAALTDTARLLGTVRLPPGASAVGGISAPGGYTGAPFAEATSALVDRHRSFLAPGGRSATLSWVLAHAPGSNDGSGALNSGERVEAFALHARPGVLSLRELVFTFTPASGGRTNVRVDAEDIYLWARSPGERVPGGGHFLAISRPALGSAPRVNRTFTDVRTVRRVAAVLDAQPVDQPGAYSCPAMRPVPTTTFTFRTSAHGAVLATAMLAGDADTGGPCGDGVSFTVRGRAQPELADDGHFLGRVGHVLGLRLALPLPTFP